MPRGKYWKLNYFSCFSQCLLLQKFHLALAAKDTMVEFNLNDLHYYHSVITGSVSYTETQFMWAMDLLARRLIDTDQLVTNVGELEYAGKLLEMTRDPEGLKKVILVSEE